MVISADVLGPPALYTANNMNWIALSLLDPKGSYVAHARAFDHPKLIWIRPDDKLNVVLSKFNNQLWIMSCDILNDGVPIVFEKPDKYETVALVERGKKIVRVTMTNKIVYLLDKAKCKWHKKLRSGLKVKLEYIDRKSGFWATRMEQESWGKVKEYHHPFVDPIIVTSIYVRRYWYYISSNHSNIKWEIDSRKEPDVRLQKVGEPPMWHPDPIPSPYASAVVLGQPKPKQSGKGIEINIDNPVNVNNPINLDNRIANGVSSTNNVLSVNSNQNANTNNNSNTNSNHNSNQNANNNNNLNSNQNNNTNQNDNSNENNNSNQNTNNVNNSAENWVINKRGKQR
jgi:hypothetical protein